MHEGSYIVTRGLWILMKVEECAKRGGKQRMGPLILGKRMSLRG